MELLDLIKAIIGKVDNVAILVLLAVNGGLFYHLRLARVESREDQKAIIDALNKNTEAMQRLQLVVAANTGKVS